MIGRVADVPIHAGNERRGAIKKILAVVHIQDGKAALWLVVIAGRKVNNEVSLIAQKARAKFLMLVELRRAHGTIITKRSLASTCWPGATSSLVTRPEMGA